MSRYLPVILTASLALGFSACETTPQSETTQPNPYGTTAETTRPQATPSPTPREKIDEPSITESSNPPVQVEPVVTPMPTPVVQDYPTATSVEGKPGFVKSVEGSGIIDVRGYPPGTEVKDPYTGKVFLVP